MVRPECYRCARCLQPWSNYYPRLRCRCGCDVLLRAVADPDAPTVLSLAGYAGAEMGLVNGGIAWSPYPLGNGTDGAHA